TPACRSIHHGPPGPRPWPGRASSCGGQAILPTLSTRRGQGDARMKYVVTYESADNVAEKAPKHFAAHVARYKHYVERGELIMIGTFADPQKDGSMAIFTTREAAEDFVKGDPFVLNGAAKSWRILT